MKKRIVGQEIVDIAVMAEQIQTMSKNVDEIKAKLENDYVTQDQFDPVKKIVYGLVGLILVTVVGALLALAIRPGIPGV